MIILTGQPFAFTGSLFLGYTMASLSTIGFIVSTLYLIVDLIDKSFSWRKGYLGLLTFSTVFLWSSISIIRKTESFLQNKAFTVGYTTQYIGGKTREIEYFYLVDNKRFVNKSNFYPLELDSINIPEGKYLVLYDSLDPQNSEMDFGYEIIHDTDFVTFTKSYINY